MIAMKKSEQYWNAACDILENDPKMSYWDLRNAAGVSGKDMDYYGEWDEKGRHGRAFFFFMVAEEHRIHGD